jgi:predicted Zn finger-like uncharacterized protein
MRYQAALRPDCSTNTADKTKFKGYIGYKFIIYLIFNAIRDHMIIECPNCSKKFNLDEKLIPKNGRTLKCSSCSHIWHHKVSLNIDNSNNKILEDTKTKSDIKPSQTDENDNEANKKNKVKDALDISKESISKKKIDDSKVEIKDKKVNNEKSNQIKMVFIYLIILVISLLGLILLLDTFKYNLSNVFPSVIPVFDSFNETMLDLKLFFKDLIN